MKRPNKGSLFFRTDGIDRSDTESKLQRVEKKRLGEVVARKPN
jgi:hypothetical protein